jgi:carbon monoxide dehydrogenase subunit G
MSEFSNDAKWQSDLIRSEKTSAGPVGLGTTGVYVQKFMGQEMKNDIVVTVFDAPKRYGQKTTSGPVQFEMLANFEEMGGGTHLTLSFKGEPGGFFKLAEGLLKGELEKTLDRDFAKLKQVLEG